MKKGGRPSAKIAESSTTRLLRSLSTPSLIALTKIAHRRDPQGVPGERPERLLSQPLRSIIIGRRPQERPVQPRQRDRYFESIRDAFRYPVQWEKKEGTKTVCQSRSERREQLFSMGIAGVGKRRSPGQGGSYKRTDKSEVVCRKVRR